MGYLGSICKKMTDKRITTEENMSNNKFNSSDYFRIALNKLLRENSVTQQELANNVGVTGHYISYISTGKRSASRALAERISSYFKMNYADVLNLGQKMVEERKISAKKNYKVTDEDEILKRKVERLEIKVRKLEKILTQMRKKTS
jgi:putative transcriptional regulator